MKSLYESTKSFISCLLNIFVTFPLKIVTNEFKETSPIKSGVHSSPLLLFRKPSSSMHFLSYPTTQKVQKMYGRRQIF